MATGPLRRQGDAEALRWYVQRANAGQSSSDPWKALLLESALEALGEDFRGRSEVIPTGKPVALDFGLYQSLLTAIGMPLRILACSDESLGAQKMTIEWQTFIAE